MRKPWNFKILLITLYNVLCMVGHSFTTVERNIPTFTCNTLCIVSTILLVNKNDMKFKKTIIIIIIIIIWLGIHL